LRVSLLQLPQGLVQQLLVGMVMLFQQEMQQESLLHLATGLELLSLLGWVLEWVLAWVMGSVLLLAKAWVMLSQQELQQELLLHLAMGLELLTLLGWVLGWVMGLVLLLAKA